MNVILKDFSFLLKKIFLNEKKLLKKRIIRSIQSDYEKEIKILPKLIEKKNNFIFIPK